MESDSYYLVEDMDVMQVGICLEIIGTFIGGIVVNVFLSPEFFRNKIPKILSCFASKLLYFVYKLLHRLKRGTTYKDFSKGLKKVTVSPIFWLLVCLFILFIVFSIRMSNDLLLIIAVVTGIFTVFLFGWIVALPPISLIEAIKLEVRKGGYTKPIGWVKYTLYLLAMVFWNGIFWIIPSILLMILMMIINALIWVLQKLATEQAPKKVAIIIGFVMIIAGLSLELIQTH
jgi:hypothetical protein